MGTGHPWEGGSSQEEARPLLSVMCQPQAGKRDCFQLLLLRREPSAKAGEGGGGPGVRSDAGAGGTAARAGGWLQSVFRSPVPQKPSPLSCFVFFFLHNIHPRTRGMIHWLSTTQQ